MNTNWTLSKDGTHFEASIDPDWKYGDDAEAYFIRPGFMAIKFHARVQPCNSRISIYRVPKDIPDKALFLNMSRVWEMCEPIQTADFDLASGAGDEELFNSLYLHYVNPISFTVRFRKPLNQCEALHG